MKQVRLAAIAYQGFGNLGDEAILTGVENLLAGSRLSVVSVLGGNRAPIAAFAGTERVTSNQLLPSIAGLRALLKAEAILVTGGGLLHDHWRIVIPRYLAWVLLARLLGRRVAWLGVGVGPLRRRSARLLARLTTRLSQLVLVRDEASARLLRDVGGRVDGVVPDPAIFHPTGAARAETGNTERPLGLIVRPPIPSAADDATRLARALADLAARIRREEQRASVLLTFAGALDTGFATQVARLIQESGGQAPAVEELAPDPHVGLVRIAACESVVSVRLHGLILAALAGVPCAGVAYDQKVASVLSELDAADVAVPLGLVDAGRLYDALKLARSSEHQLRVQRAVSRLVQRRGEIVEQLERALA